MSEDYFLKLQGFYGIAKNTGKICKWSLSHPHQEYFHTILFLILNCRLPHIPKEIYCHDLKYLKFVCCCCSFKMWQPEKEPFEIVLNILE